MLMIILGILKVTGILLLVLLGIILLLILLVLFCPVRYAGTAEKSEGQQFRTSGDITWLLHLLHLRVTAEGTQPEVSVRILGISPESFGKLMSVFRRKSRTEKKFFGRSTDRSIETIDSTTSAKAEIIADGNEIAAQNKARLSVKSKECSAENEETIPADNKKCSVKNGDATNGDATFAGRIIKRIMAVGRKILDILKKLFHLPGYLATGINKGVSQGKAAAEKVSGLKAFVSTHEFKEALTFGFGRLMRLLRHLRPTKLSGKVEFGFSDPADTGMVLALAAPFFPYYADHLQIIPDFQEKRLSFSLKFKGRIYGCMLLCLALQILLDSNIRSVIGKIRKRRSE